MRIWMLALVTAFTLGCAAVKLGPLDSKFKVKADKQETRLSLALGAEVPDKFTIPAQGGVRKVRVKGWHETLTRAFENGLAKTFEVTPPEEEHDLQLVIVQAELQFLPSPGLATDGNAAAKAKLIYQARILSAEGDVLAVSAGEPTSKGTWTEPGEQVDVTKEVIKTMYKDIVYDILTKIPAEEAEPTTTEPAEEPTD